MIVPEYWAEARIQQRFPDRQVTVRRFGWSDESQEAAQTHADERVREAFDRIVAGESLPRREQRKGYNGAEGTPIREEIVQRHGETIITRNAYGALCLNTPDVLFADIDCAGKSFTRAGCWTVFVSGMMLAVAANQFFNIWISIAAFFLGALLISMLISAIPLLDSICSVSATATTRRNTDDVMQRYSNCARLYSTPAGFRLLVTHQTFDPNSSEVAEFFQALGVDPIYATMCRRQNCFRARISPKPWRIGMERHIQPVRGGWPVAEELLPSRRGWVVDYDRLAAEFSSCRFETEYGTMPESDAIRFVRELHDDACKALSGLPIA